MKALQKRGDASKFLIRIEATPDYQYQHDNDVDNNNNGNGKVRAIFDGWVIGNKEGSKFSVELNEVSRMDTYGSTSRCVLQRALHLKQFCRCKKQ